MAKIEIVQGEYKQFVITLSEENGERFDLSSYDLFTVCLPGTSGDVSITETPNVSNSDVALNGSAEKGELIVTIYPTDTDLLKVGRDQNVYLEVSATLTPELARRFVLDRVLIVTAFDC